MIPLNRGILRSPGLKLPYKMRWVRPALMLAATSLIVVVRGRETPLLAMMGVIFGTILAVALILYHSRRKS